MASDALVDANRKAVKLIGKHVKNPKIIFDLGASVGVFTCLLAQKFPETIIHAFEPVPNSFATLTKNVKNNGFEKRVTLYNVALWSKKSRLIMGMPAGRDQRNTGLYSAFHDRGKVIRVDAVSLDSITDIIPDFVKMDVEGAETYVIRGGKDKFSKMNHIYIERGKTPDPAIDVLLSELGMAKITEGHDEIWGRK